MGTFACGDVYKKGADTRSSARTWSACVHYQQFCARARTPRYISHNVRCWYVKSQSGIMLPLVHIQKLTTTLFSLMPLGAAAYHEFPCAGCEPSRKYQVRCHDTQEFTWIKYPRTAVRSVCVEAPREREHLCAPRQASILAKTHAKLLPNWCSCHGKFSRASPHADRYSAKTFLYIIPLVAMRWRFCFITLARNLKRTRLSHYTRALAKIWHRSIKFFLHVKFHKWTPAYYVQLVYILLNPNHVLLIKCDTVTGLKWLISTNFHCTWWQSGRCQSATSIITV